METLEKMKELAEKTSFTDEEKAAIVSQCEKLSIEFHPSARCRTCYQDAAIQCVIAMKMDEESKGTGFRLKSGVDVLVNGRRLNAATITDDWRNELSENMPDAWMTTYFDFNEPTDEN